MSLTKSLNPLAASGLSRQYYTMMRLNIQEALEMACPACQQGVNMVPRFVLRIHQRLGRRRTE